MSSPRDRRKAKKMIRIPNLYHVEGRATPVPEGTYVAKVIEVSQEEGQAADYLRWVFEIIEGNQKGKKLYYNTSMAEQALWNLRSLLEALGQEIPDDELDIDPSDMLDLEIILTVEHEKYEGRPRAKVIDFGPVNEKNESDEEEEKPSRSKKASHDEDDEEEARRLRRAERRKKRKERAKQAEDEEEDEEEPTPRKSDKPAPKETYSDDEISEDDLLGMSQDELSDFISEHDLDVDLDDYKGSLRQMRKAVINAARKSDIIE